MLDKIFKNSEKKYCFTINNTFHIIYFLSIIKKYKLKNYLFIINNTNDFFINGKYNKIFDKENIKYKIIKGEDSFRKFPHSIIDIIIFKTYIINNLKDITGYKLIISGDSTISNNIIVKYLSKKNELFSLIDTTIYSMIKNNNLYIIYIIYKLYLKILGVNRGLKSGIFFNYKYKIYSKDLDKNIIRKNINYLEYIFSKKLNKLNNIKTKKNIIFLSQNIIDEYKINKNIFIEKIRKIKNFYDLKGYNFSVKPHPLENTSYYEKKFNIIDKSIPSELLDIYFGEKDTIYITFFSSVINNINFGKKYLIGNIGFGENEKQIINMLNKDFNIPYLNLNE